MIYAVEYEYNLVGVMNGEGGGGEVRVDNEP